MITFAKSYQTSDSNVFASLELAQKHELTKLLEGEFKDRGSLVPIQVAEILVEHHVKVVDILTTKSSSRPRARKINRAAKTTPKTPQTAVAA